MKQKQTQSRRRLIETAGFVAMGVTTWRTPVVQHVVLPAHGQTSDTEMDSSDAEVGPTTLSPDDIVRIIIEPLVLGKSPHR